MHLRLLISHTCKVISFNDRDDIERFFAMSRDYTFVSALYESVGESFTESTAFQRIRGCPLQEYPYSRFYCIHLYIIDASFTLFFPRVIYQDIDISFCFR